MAKTGYQGWTNWETWHVNLLADNDETIYQQAWAMARACVKYEQKGTFDMARAVQGFHRVLRQATRETLTHAKSAWPSEPVEAINWPEIVTHWMDTVKEEARDQETSK